jgi:serine/threonine protein kinase
LDPLQPTDPRDIGSYRLVGRLGSGGMGQVFLGRSPGGRPVAVKLVAPGLANDPDFRRRFAQEVEAARKVGGFHTAQVVDADTSGSQPWLVSAYIPGPSLQDAVSNYGPLPLHTVRVLAAGLAEGLSAVHSSGLVHRDLKPANVILSSDGPRLIDFGIARALDSAGGTLTASGSVIGSPGFMSPEQASGHPDIGPASDVFSLGAVLAFASTAVGPYGTGSLPAIIYRIMNQPPELGQVPDQIRGVVAACMARDPAQRPAVADLLRYFADAAQTTDDWLPAAISDMISERVSWTGNRSGSRTVQQPPITPPPTLPPGTGLPPQPAYGMTGYTHPMPATAPPQHHTPPPGSWNDDQPRRSYLPFAIGGAALAVIAAIVAVVVIVSGGGKSGGGGGSTAVPNPNAAVVGNWTGTYTCSQGPTNLNLTINDQAGGGITAIFAFGSASNNSVPPGSFAMKGTYSGGTLTLNPDHWIQRPTDYEMVGLTAHVQGTAPTSISGNVIGQQSTCTTFNVARSS